MRFPFNGSFRITQNFGENPENYARFGLKGHNGIDFGLYTGVEVVATHSGKVLEATNDPYGYGQYIKIENDNEGSLYAHLKEFKVVVGVEVSEGQVLGISDNTGNSTAPHLHYGYYTKPRDRANGYSGYIDPLPFLTQKEEPKPDNNVKKATRFDQIISFSYSVGLVASDKSENYVDNDDLLNVVKGLHDETKRQSKQIEDLRNENESLRVQLSNASNVPVLEAPEEVKTDVSQFSVLERLSNFLKKLGF